ncbi:5'-methylthioadenosine/S-adenosylhomocysteine nucleosidase family protein [Aspergillus alliaceus]|uniref:5'-methylthioadenosine/S-adenosylhomocysteine nucleosidase family protein n=1 Tax=Petromyces alliaceus TaxID=209559 RepID=UPI0012A65362|nr:nucleoside phosphorylase domain-containing protein [Aspergillus alliaceus]KAB8236422.1 nucleoside phosphorylase domain-containing protein [Aspergillus alliaceus]
MWAAKIMLDEVHPSLRQPQSDHNVYTLGSISGHNVVVACLPSGVCGTISASAVVAHMVSTSPNTLFGLMVGIGGRVLSKHVDIRLGDVVVSKPTATLSGVIQYDYGKNLHYGRFQHNGTLNKPPPVLLKLVNRPERTTEQPKIHHHYGLIASGDQAMKDAGHAAALIDKLPLFVIQGIWNYCDFYKE